MQDYKVQTREQLEYYRSDEAFGTRDGFMIAANIFDNLSVSTLNDPSIGSIGFVLTNITTDPNFEGNRVNRTPLQTRPCTQSDFAYTDEESNTSWFYKIREKDREVLTKHGEMLLCLQNPEELKIYGNYDTRVWQNLQVAFRPCKNETESGLVCKSKEEINRWQLSKHITMLINHNEFIKHEFGENTMQKESKIIRQTLTPRTPS